jgi:hypothetical protein
MSRHEYEHHVPRNYKNKSKQRVSEDFDENRPAKISFKPYLLQIREQETMDEMYIEPVYKPGEIVDLTPEHEKQIIEDFVRWSGGYYPDEMNDSELQEYATKASAAEFDSDTVLRFIRNYVKED